MPSQTGVAVNFSFASAAAVTVGSPSMPGMLMQNLEHQRKSEMARIRDGTGTSANITYYDFEEEATLVFKVTAAGIAAAQAATTSAAFGPGTIVNITACASRPDLVQSNWVVKEEGPRVRGTNVEAAEYEVPLRRNAGITGAAGA